MNWVCQVACRVIVLVAPMWVPAPWAVARSGSLSHFRSTTASVHDQLVGIHGRSLFLRCMGTGAATVVLDDAGFVEAWLAVQPTLAHFARVCAYDRAGLGMSDPGPVPTSTGQLVSDLHTLLRRARVPRPYILVGHAFGGDTAQLYASLYPRDMDGLVLVDAIPSVLLAHALISNGDDVNVQESRRDMQRAGSLSHLPLVVLAHGIPYSYPPKVEERWPALQRHLARLSTNSLFVVTGSGQNIPAVLPDAVIDAVRTVIVMAISGWHPAAPALLETKRPQRLSELTPQSGLGAPRLLDFGARQPAR